MSKKNLISQPSSMKIDDLPNLETISEQAMAAILGGKAKLPSFLEEARKEELLFSNPLSINPCIGDDSHYYGLPCPWR